MSAKHTPAPWLIDAEDNLIHAADDRHTVVCSFGTTLRNPQVMADARLIAAAPELLEALMHAVDWLNAAGIAETMPVQQQARAAIAKADGT